MNSLLSFLLLITTLSLAAPPPAPYQPWITKTAVTTITDVFTEVVSLTTSVAPQDPLETERPFFCSDCLPVTRTLTFKPSTTIPTGTPFRPTDQCELVWPDNPADPPPLVTCEGDWHCEVPEVDIKTDCDLAVQRIDPKATYNNPTSGDTQLTHDMGVWFGHCAVFAMSPNFKGCHITGEELLVRYNDIRKYCQNCGALEPVGNDQHCAVVIDYIDRPM